MSVDSDKATCKPREKTMSAKKRSRPTAPSAAPTGVPAPPRPAALPRPAAADNSTAGRAARPRIRITLSPEYQNKFDALTSELGSLGADDLSTTSVIEHLVDTVFYNAFGTRRCYLIGYQCPRRLSRHCCHSSWLRQSWSCPVLREALSGPQSPHPVLNVLNCTKTVLLFTSFVGRIRRFLIKKTQKKQQHRSITHECIHSL